MSCYIGLMSGTSLDGVDGVLVDFADDAHGAMRVLAHHAEPLDASLRAELLALNSSGPDELHRAAIAANGVARAYAAVVTRLLDAAGLHPNAVRAIGAHGQTVRHRPGEFDGLGYTLQLLNGALLAEICNIDVVCDLRSRDVAAGGQGAPLVPAFHAAQFGQPGQPLVVLNLGGMANLTLLDGAGGVRGFDCGPGNVLLDAWCLRHNGRAFDADGQWASSGQVNAALLARLSSEPFLHKAPPKSTGRDLFDMAWLLRALDDGFNDLPAVDVQATLADLTVSAAVRDLQRHLPQARRLLVCGGGALNGDLMRRLRAAVPTAQVQSTADAGLPPQQVEAAAFAWLARACVQRQPGNCTSVTGARGPRVLGALHPAR